VGLLVILPAVVPLATGGEPRSVNALGTGVWAFAGGISYGIFLYHVTVLSWVERAIGHRAFGGDFAELMVGTLLVTVVVATASYRWLERPIMRLGRHNRRFDVRTASSLDDVPTEDRVAMASPPTTSA
jgi:peptidoglycan/LPS O-acetylase OafA/YrhL